VRGKKKRKTKYSPRSVDKELCPKIGQLRIACNLIRGHAPEKKKILILDFSGMIRPTHSEFQLRFPFAFVVREKRSPGCACEGKIKKIIRDAMHMLDACIDLNRPS
jgi:hypothetical protein